MIPLVKFAALLASILSLCGFLGDTFFIPGSSWHDRLMGGIAMLVLSGCVCFASGIVFELPDRQFDPEPPVPLTQTLPVRLFFWTVALMAVIFVLSWFLAVDFVPHIWKNQPY